MNERLVMELVQEVLGITPLSAQYMASGHSICNTILKTKRNHIQSGCGVFFRLSMAG
jgi:hypothetical protein